MDSFLRKFSLLLAISAIGITFFLSGLYSGVGFGVGRGSDYVYGKGLFYITHSDPYYILQSYFLPLTWSLVALMLLKVFEKGWVSRTLALIPLGTAIFCWVNFEKVRYSYISDPEPYLDALRLTSNVSWTTGAFLLTASILQVVLIVLAFRSRPKDTPETLP